ncbi:MAG: GFA family protein [Myxococcales bacterium]|nr:GFA family protein [Myxococcales bacterium]
MATTKPMTGKCLCGAVTFTAEDVDPHVHACHCDMCRRWSGGPGMAIYVGSIAFSGEENITAYASSAWAERGFCRICGSNLFYRVKEPNRWVLWSGTLDDPSALELAGEIYIDEKPDFYAFAGERKRLTGAEFLKSIGLA